MFSKLFVAASLASAAFAKLAITYPVSTSTMSGGSPYNVTWEDDGTGGYTLAQFGVAQVSLAIGGTTTQEILQILGDVDTSTTQMWQFNLDPSIGPNGEGYFIRFDSVYLTDPSSGGKYPMQSFSAKFTLDSMTGTFNSTQQALLSGGSVPSSSSSSAASSPTGKSSAAVTSAGADSKVATTTSSASSSSSSNAAGAVQPQLWMGALFGAALFAFSN